MADDLKRVGLVFKADGSVDFKKSLKEVNASVQENRSAFKLAQSQWNESTKSMDKLKDSQKYLADQTKDYSDKVKLLQSELKELENAEKRDELAIQKKQAQLNTAKTSLNNYQKSLEEVSQKLKSGTVQLEEYAKKLDDIGSKATAMGKTMSKNVSAPIAAIGALAIKSAMELDEGYDTIITKTGATGDALQELNDVADEIFGSMPVEMSDVGVAVGEINTRFGETGDNLKELSKQFMQFAEINGVDLNASIGEVDKIMEQFNVNIGDTGNLLGILTKRSQETGISTDVLIQTVSSNSATFKELGFSVTDSINLLAQFESNGVDASAAMTGMRKAITNMAADGLSAGEALGSVVDSIKNATTETEAINIASEVFGTKGAVQMTDAIRSGRLSLDELSDSLSAYTGVVNDTYEATLDPWDKMKLATNNLKLAGSELAAEMFEVLAPMMETLVGGVKELTEWFSGLDEGQKKTIVTIGMIALAIGPLLLVFGTMSSGISNIIRLTTSIIGIMGKVPGILGTIGTGAKTLWGIMAANPIGAVVTVIGLLIAAFVTAYTKCEWFRDGVNKIFGGVVDFIKGAVQKIKNFFKFDWELPKIKLPHFKMTGKFSLSPPSIPKIGVDWYAKGGILSSPTIFGQNGDDFMGGGEAGKEAVLPIDLLREYIRDEISKNNSQLAQMLMEAISEIKLVAENNIFIGDKKIESILTDMVMSKITDKTQLMRLARGW